MSKVSWKYVILAIILCILVSVISLAAFPGWSGKWWLLAAAVAVGVFAFLANFRQAIEKNEPAASSGSKNVEVKVSTSRNITTIGTQINAATVNFTQTRSFSPGFVPPVPSLILGRDEDLKNLRERLKVVNQGTSLHNVLIAIKGWPGVGKTTIASAIAHDPELQNDFPDGVLWVSLGQEPTLLPSLISWERALGSEAVAETRNVEEAKTKLAALLRDRSMLLIVDDVWKVEDALPFLAGGKSCAALVTTRLDGVAGALAPTASSVYRLNVLKEEDAIALLAQLAPSVAIAYPEECLTLVRELEGLPLALQVAGRLLNAEAEYGFNIVSLIQELREGAKLLQAQAPADRMDLVMETTPTIAALLQKSVDVLDPVTREQFSYLGVFAPKPATFDLEAMKYLWQVDDPRPIIKMFIDRGLLEYVPQFGRYQMHALFVMLAKSNQVEK